MNVPLRDIYSASIGKYGPATYLGFPKQMNVSVQPDHIAERRLGGEDRVHVTQVDTCTLNW